MNLFSLFAAALCFEWLSSVLWTLNFWIAILFILLLLDFEAMVQYILITEWTHQVSFNLKTCVEVPCIQNHKEDQIAVKFKVRFIKLFAAIYSSYPLFMYCTAGMLVALEMLCFYKYSFFLNSALLVVFWQNMLVSYWIVFDLIAH